VNPMSKRMVIPSEDQSFEWVIESMEREGHTFEEFEIYMKLAKTVMLCGVSTCLYSEDLDEMRMGFRYDKELEMQIEKAKARILAEEEE